MNSVVELPDEFEALGVVVPESFWPAVGYGNDARYVAVYCSLRHGDACWRDGRHSLIGANWSAYKALTDRFDNETRWALSILDDSPTNHDDFWLVVDRHGGGQCWLAPVAVAYNFLAEQWNDVPGHPAIQAVLDKYEASELSNGRFQLPQKAIDELADVMSGIFEKKALSKEPLPAFPLDEDTQLELVGVFKRDYVEANDGHL